MVDNKLLNGLVNEVGQLIEYNKEPIAYPWMGVIINTTSSKYCDIQVEGKGVLKDVPCHGIPEKGDSVIIHFIEGKYEMPVADCPHRLPPSSTVLESYYQEECFNYLINGDFHDGLKGYSVSNAEEVSLVTGESYTITSENTCVLNTLHSYIETTVDIRDITSDEFKFQCVYTGLGELKVECRDADTNKIIQTLPYNLRSNYKIWTNPYGRNNWSFNKEVYPVVEEGVKHEKIKIRLTNSSSSEEIFIEDPDNLDEMVSRQRPYAMMVDALLVFEENGDTNYYPSVNDVITE